MNDEPYCPRCDNKLTWVSGSFLFSEYFYCEGCDEFYHKRLVVIPPENIEFVSSKRRDEMRTLARIIKAKTKVTREDLITLGYL